MLNEEEITRKISTVICRLITRRTISALQKLKGCLQSGDDSGLENTWDEICVQLQLEESVFWDMYDEIVRSYVLKFVGNIQAHEKYAVWLQTDAGSEWEFEDEEERDSDPYLEDDVVDYIVSEYIWEQAGTWSNRRIRRCIDNSYLD